MCGGTVNSGEAAACGGFTAHYSTELYKAQEKGTVVYRENLWDGKTGCLEESRRIEYNNGKADALPGGGFLDGP